MARPYLFAGAACILLAIPHNSMAFAPHSLGSRLSTWRLELDPRKNSDQFNRELEDNSYRKAQGKSTLGETAAGAILGGLVLGPFGALFGAQIGASMGSKRVLDEARKDEMKRMGVNEDMLRMAQECGVALEEATRGLQATHDSLSTQQRLARRLDEDANRLYEQAKTSLEEPNGEEAARDYLMKRQRTQDRLKQVLLNCAEEKKRLNVMEDNVAALEQRALEVESVLRRAVGAKAVVDSGEFSLKASDPLLQKFKDMGID